ncbi:hypothetical protein KCU90_g7663, partial [Aureobasidium melanogenum]
MTQTLRPDRLRAFVGRIASLVDERAPEAQLLDAGGAALRELIAHDDWLPDAFAQPDLERYQQFLLHADSQQRFSIVSFVWGPGQSTPVHDHTVWGLIGVLRGAEIAQGYRITSGGTLEEEGLPKRLDTGAVDAVSPAIGDIHRVSNAFRDQFRIRSFKDVRRALLEREEIALVDVREEDPHARSHPLFAANLPLSRLELDAPVRLPRRDVPLVVFDDGEGLAERAASRLSELGYTDVALLENGLQGWREAGGELFQDVNVPSKAFGELVESERHTPSLGAPQVQALLDHGADVVVLDARRFDEYQTMNIPGSISVPGAELVLRARQLAPNPATRIIVNCAGRTRSIIGAQSLINAGVPNPVAALRNGTIGWTLAGQALAHGSSRRFDPIVDDTLRLGAADSAREVADRARVGRTSRDEARRWADEAVRTVYRFDVRTPEEYEAGHVPGFRNAPGGQLVQETDMFAPVRGARVILADNDGVRANMTASWLAQMNIEVYVVDGLSNADFAEKGPAPAARYAPAPPEVDEISPAQLVALLQSPGTIVLDFTTSANYVKRHIPGAWFAIRGQLEEALRKLPDAQRYVATCGSSLLARFAAPELAALTGKPVQVLSGGTNAWIEAGLAVESGETRLASPRIDRYRRPYEGTDNAREAMNAYLEWEYGLVAQLGRDGTHGFRVL